MEHGISKLVPRISKQEDFDQAIQVPKEGEQSCDGINFTQEQENIKAMGENHNQERENETKKWGKLREQRDEAVCRF
jgi:hypothetical protein